MFTVTDEITTSDKYIDSRDVIKRIEELQSDRDVLQGDLDEASVELEAARDALDDATVDDEGIPVTLMNAIDLAQSVYNKCKADLNEWEKEHSEELSRLLDLQSGAEGYCDWIHGATLINDEYFEEYAKQLAEDIGAINPKEGWPLHCIDWSRAAEELKMDYTAVDFDGTTYWMI